MTSRIPCGPEFSQHDGPDWSRITCTERRVLKFTAPKTDKPKEPPKERGISPKKKRIFELYTSGLAATQIAAKVGLDARTVDWHLATLVDMGLLELRRKSRKNP